MKIQQNRAVLCVFVRLAVVALALASFSYAQNTGVISGIVTDPTKAVVPAASVTIVNEDTGVTIWTGKTNGSGVYRAPSLGPGRYRIAVEASGFKTATVSGVNLTVDQRSDINVALSPGAVAESITVEGDVAGQLATDSSSLGSVINTGQVQDLPLPSRNIMNLALADPGHIVRRRRHRYQRQPAFHQRQPHRQQRVHGGRHLGGFRLDGRRPDAAAL